MSRNLRIFVNVVAYFSMIGYNYWVLRTVSPLGILNMVDQYRIYILPIDATYFVWSAIYAYLLGYIILQTIYPYNQESYSIRSIDFLFPISCGVYIGWVYFFLHQYFTLSIVFIVLFLFTLIAIYYRLKIGLSKHSKDTKEMRIIRTFVHIPFSMYLAWVTIIGFINFSYALNVLKFHGFKFHGFTFTLPMLAIIIMGVTTLIALTLFFARKDYAYIIVIVLWLFGISMRQVDNALVSGTSAAIAFFLCLLLIISYIRTQKTGPTFKFENVGRNIL